MSTCRKKREATAAQEAVFLRRKITLTRAIALIAGAMVGSGIFISPKGVLKNTGSVGVSLLVWLACGILSLFGELFCFQLTFVQSAVINNKKVWVGKGE